MEIGPSNASIVDAPPVPPALRSWRPGESGNPSGANGNVMRRVHAACGKDAGRIVDYLVNILMNERERTADRTTAATILLERGYGKPASTVDLTFSQPTNPLTELGAEQLAALIALGEQVLERKRELEAQGELNP